MWEMPFWLAALHGGLELEPDTSPPVLRRIPRFPAGQVGAVERPDRTVDGPGDADDGPFDLAALGAEVADEHARLAGFRGVEVA